MVGKQNTLDFICLKCDHFKHKGSYSPLFKCKAFPKGIPKLIVNGGNIHSNPFKEQNNDLVFKLKR